MQDFQYSHQGRKMVVNKISMAFLAVLLFMLLFGHSTAASSQDSLQSNNYEEKDEKITVEYPVFFSDAKNATHIQTKVTSKPAPFLKFMRIAACKNKTFRFKCKNYPKMGCFVTEISGVSQNATAGIYWAFLRFFPTAPAGVPECLLPLGVSSYNATVNGDRLGFRLVPSDYWNKTPQCKN